MIGCGRDQVNETHNSDVGLSDAQKNRMDP